ncbi:P-loop containing nucleoside triphosphate hydrolase protein [Cyathus striatus]|nr:P-loop containing nucleoside triphosphate hydrolase protein [Cyathus striatus]
MPSVAQSGEIYHDAIKEYKEHFLGLLKAEEAVDEAELKERLSTWGMKRLREEGYCVTDLRAYWLKANQFGRPVASFDLGTGVTLPDHRFESGAQVLLSRVDPLQEDHVKGSVISSTASQLRVCFSEQFDDLDDGLWRLDLGRVNMVFERMRTAISHMNQDPQVIEELSHNNDRQLILQGTRLRDILLRSFDPQPHERFEASQAGLGAFADNMLIQSWAKRYACDNPLVMEGDPVLEGLNASQRKAIATMIGERISLVQGPPGTGKTKTIIETIRLLKDHFQVPHPILVCTFTNVAVDNLTEGFLKASMNPLRVSFNGHPRASILEHSLDYKLERHPLHHKLATLVKEEEEVSVELHDLEKRISKLETKIDGGKKTHALEGRLKNMKLAALVLQRRRNVLKRRCYATKQEMLKDVLDDADVICTTCVTSACNALNIMDFPVVFLDEASMSTEPASLIPLMKGSRHVALIGDHKQLPPVIISPDAQSGGLATSLFERLMEERTVPSVMLDIQYRMHPSISLFPSLEFYNLSVRDGTVDQFGNTTGKRPSLIFLDHSGMESRKGRSKVNVTEANIVISVVEDLLLQNPVRLRGEDIGIIAPYVSQIALLTRLLTVDEPYKARFKETLGDHGLLQLSQIDVKTVDGFEGREKDIIIFSTVRNNTGGYIGFLADRRRLNVGLTRAKRGLFVIGNIKTLKTGRNYGEAVVKAEKGDFSWRHYVSFLSEQGLVVRLSGDKLERALYGNWKSAGSRGLGVLKG